MSSDRIVTPQDVLRALMDVRRRGTQPAMEELEQREPDLTEFLLEELTAIHHELLALRDKPKRVRRLTRRIETLALVLVASLRQAQLRLWQDAAAGTPLERIDPSLAKDPPERDRPPPPASTESTGKEETQ